MYDGYMEIKEGVEMITSIKNNRVKQWKKLQTKKGRLQTETFLIEGPHLIEEAHKSGWQIKEMIVQEGVDVPFAPEHAPITSVSATVFQSVAQTETPQGIMAVVNMKEPQITTDQPLLLVDRVQDPGNLGTMIRTADAAGFSAIMLGEGTVDVYNDKVIRATQGSLFHIPFVQVNLVEEIRKLKQTGYAIWVSALEQAKNYRELQVEHEKIALVVGNEGAGVQNQLIKEADEVVKIPIYGQAESLNVSIAAAILMYDIKGKLAQPNKVDYNN